MIGDKTEENLTAQHPEAAQRYDGQHPKHLLVLILKEHIVKLDFLLTVHIIWSKSFQLKCYVGILIVLQDTLENGKKNTLQ